jgi:hypothetical protein
MPIPEQPTLKGGLDQLTHAYAVRYEGRWWIFHYTPSGTIVRIFTSYPSKTAAVQAMGILGYTQIQPPADAAPKELGAATS